MRTEERAAEEVSRHGREVFFFLANPG